MSAEESIVAQRATASCLGAFFDELASWGVHDVVVSPGSRSTPLAMTVYEFSRRFPARARVFVDADERGAAFLALGMAKASGRPAALICTSGTAVANYYPAVLEAESSRVPLIVLTGDRPSRLQGLGAPQTCDQLKIYGDHVRLFRQMPLPPADAAVVAFMRQTAREACIHAGGGERCQTGESASSEPAVRLAGACLGGPVHLNFPFDEPLRPDFDVVGLFETGRVARGEAPGADGDSCGEGMEFTQSASLVRGMVPTCAEVGARDAERVIEMFASRRTLVFAGEGTCATGDEARTVLDWARAFGLPLLADPLSGLRSFDESLVIDNYDSVFGPGGAVPAELAPEAVIRFGRYPVSKKATQCALVRAPLEIVVDLWETRDFNSGTDLFVRCRPCDFVRSTIKAVPSFSVGGDQVSFADAWITANDDACARIEAVDGADTCFEGTFVHRVMELAPAGSCVFAASSMSIRALDTFHVKSDKPLTVLCNRGLNGIDGTVSTAIGAAQYFDQTTLIIGDIALLHDMNALALQRELRVRGESDGACAKDEAAPHITVVLLNNNGGGIFDMLPQKSDEDFFERLFLTPQDVDFESAARAFRVPYRRARTIAEFDASYQDFLGVPGISLIEVPVPLTGLEDRYAPYWSVDGDS